MCKSLPSRLLVAGFLTFAAAQTFALPSVGEPVFSIPFANEITRFERIDNQHLLVSVDPKRTYLLELKEQCHRLSFARHIGVSMANNTIWAGFDYVTADGSQCTIDSIQRVSSEVFRPAKS